MSEGDESTAASGTIETPAELGLPRFADLADPELVDRAVQHIRAVLASTVSRGMEEVGRYLLEEFFENDPRLYFSTAPKKHASLRMLIERSESLDLPVSRTFLSNALRVAVAAKELPREASFHELPASHRVELVRLREPEKVERLAAQAVERGLSVQKIRELVRREATKSKRSNRGRRPTPPVLRAIDHCLRMLRDEETGRLLFLKSDVSELTDEQRERAETALRSLEKRVAELRRILPER